MTKSITIKALEEDGDSLALEFGWINLKLKIIIGKLFC